jgi:hypothetical protein
MKDEKDYGMLYSVALIMLAITFGCSLVLYIDQQAIIDYKLECALQDFERKVFGQHKTIKHRPVANVEEAIPTGMIQSMVLQ